MTRKAQPRLSPIPQARFQLGGAVGERLQALVEQWILPAPRANPAMLEMFRRRDRQPYLQFMPWAGEFAGKYLTHSVQIWRLIKHGAAGAEHRTLTELEEHLRWFVAELISCQAEDGYLGPWPAPWQLRVGAPNAVDPTWDAWGHYHVMLGLLLWHAETGDQRALQCVRRIGDLMCRRFLDEGESLHDTLEQDKNLAPIHSLVLLHQVTGEPRYLELARRIEQDLQREPAGDYIRLALSGVPFHDTPKPRWEGLHTILALPELFYVTGEEYYSEAFQHLWWSMVEGDRHNNGGFSAGEKAVGDPYATGAIETCCTVAWMAMCVEMLRLRGDPLVADELELSMLNSGLGLISASGRWVTYDTPSDGHREASAHSIVFQARAGSPELNCCAVNGPRSLGLLCEGALMRGKHCLALNYYGPGSIESALPDGAVVTLTMKTTYPVDPHVEITLGLESPRSFALALRIPAWSEQTRVLLNDEPQAEVHPGAYFCLDREWQPGDRVELQFDFRPHFWLQPGSDAGACRLTSIYRGPILLTYDPRFNAGKACSELPSLDALNLSLKPVSETLWPQPWMLLEALDIEGNTIKLCDFASAGAAGDSYLSWLPVRFPTTTECRFSKTNLLRSFRP